MAALSLLCAATLSAMTHADGLAAHASWPVGAAPAATPTVAPNVIFVVVDDADLSLMRYLPKTRALIADQGATFTHYYDSVALCCSARTTFLRGQYTHNTGIWDNAWPLGGFGRFHLSEEGSTLATWLAANHYQTSLIGKYLNEYPDVRASPEHGVDPSYVPPGWSNWVSPVDGDAYKEFHYKLNINGRVDAHFRTDDNPANYMVDTISRMASRYVLDQTDPYFLYVTPFAPHPPFVPAPRYAHDFPGLTYPQTPAFNEADVSDKPPWIARRPRFTRQEVRALDHDYRLRAQDMEALDDLVQRLYDAVRDSGQLGRTYFVFTSDNGLHMGEHRLYLGKDTPYEPDIRLPLWISGPGIAPGTTIRTVVGDIDIGPTIADLTGTPTPGFVDGRSLVPLLDGQRVDWRSYLVLERAWISPGSNDDGGANGLDEPVDPDQIATSDVPAYEGLHSARYVYVDYANGVDSQEFYDLAADPYELVNLLGPGSPGLTDEQRAALEEMRSVLSSERTCSFDTTPCH